MEGERKAETDTKGLPTEPGQGVPCGLQSSELTGEQGDRAEASLPGPVPSTSRAPVWGSTNGWGQADRDGRQWRGVSEGETERKQGSRTSQKDSVKCLRDQTERA